MESLEEQICIYPIYTDDALEWSEPFSFRDFQEFEKRYPVEIIGILQETALFSGKHWRWAPYLNGNSSPSLNPSNAWGNVASNISLFIDSQDIELLSERGFSHEQSKNYLSEVKMCAQHISISLHQLNLSILRIAKHLQKELEGKLTEGPSKLLRYKHLRGLDLTSDVHSFFQSFASARDYLALFLGFQLECQKTTKNGLNDSLAKLFGSTSPETLRGSAFIRMLENEDTIRVIQGKVENRFSAVGGSYLGFSNSLRNRFAHRAPYGSLELEQWKKTLLVDEDKGLFLLKAYLLSNDNETKLDLLRTISGIYRKLCRMFLKGAAFSGFKADPKLIKL